MRTVEGAVLDVLFWQDDAVVLTPTQILRLSLAGSVVLRAAIEGQSQSELRGQVLVTYPDVDPDILSDAIAAAVRELVSLGILVPEDQDTAPLEPHAGPQSSQAPVVDAVFEGPDGTR